MASDIPKDHLFHQAVQDELACAYIRTGKIPPITHWKVKHTRHTNFALDDIERTFQETKDFGKSIATNIYPKKDFEERMRVRGHKMYLLDVMYLVNLAKHHNLDHLHMFLLDFPIATNYTLRVSRENNVDMYYVDKHGLEYRPAQSLNLEVHCALTDADASCVVVLNPMTYLQLDALVYELQRKKFIGEKWSVREVTI